MGIDPAVCLWDGEHLGCMGHSPRPATPGCAQGWREHAGELRCCNRLTGVTPSPLSHQQQHGSPHREAPRHQGTSPGPRVSLLNVSPICPPVPISLLLHLQEPISPLPPRPTSPSLFPSPFAPRLLPGTAAREEMEPWQSPEAASEGFLGLRPLPAAPMRFSACTHHPWSAALGGCSPRPALTR